MKLGGLNKDGALKKPAQRASLLLLLQGFHLPAVSLALVVFKAWARAWGLYGKGCSLFSGTSQAYLVVWALRSWRDESKRGDASVSASGIFKRLLGVSPTF